MSTDESKLSDTIQTKVPTVLEVKIDLLPGGTETLAINTQIEVVLRDIVATATGPVLLRIFKENAAGSDTPTIMRPGLGFPEYLEQELPVHLAALVGEGEEDWAKVNGELAQGAEAGDDEAFFTLLARDPRHFTSEQTLRRVLTWQTEVFDYYRDFGYKASQFWAEGQARADAQQRMEYCKQCLRRFGQCPLELYDRRGKRPLPPAGHVRGIYYGLLCVLQGLREVYKACEESRYTQTQCERTLDALVRGLMTLRGGSPFLIYIVVASRLLMQPEIRNLTGRTDLLWDHMLRGRGLTPSETARAVTASAFEVSEDSIERLCAEPAPIPLPSSNTDSAFLVGRPDFALLEFPEVRPLWESLLR